MLAALLVAAALAPLPANVQWDYQIGGDYPPPAGTGVVVRDWFSGTPRAGAYSVCYVNAFQTQDDEAGVARPDERSAWPRRLVLRRLGADPNWGGEYLVDLRSAAKRRRAARWVAPMLRRCADKGFAAVELDNLDSWTRFDGTPLAGDVPFGRRAAVDYAARLTRRAHALGLAVAQKNTVQLTRREARGRIGFDFALAEECGRYRECEGYTRLYGDRVLAVEYRRRDFARACDAVGDRVAVILRDRLVSRPGAPAYRYAAC
jgi:hypothetical protein